eukprot:11168123-Lingulodinium_polyedra.AAC.1
MAGNESQGAPSAKKRKVGANKREVDVKTKELQAATTLRVNVLKKLKRDLDKTNSDIRTAEMLARRMCDEKGFPESMQQWFMERVSAFK